MLHKHLWVVYVLSDSCSVTALWDCCTRWRSGWFCKHPPEDPPGGKVAWAVPWPGQPPARFSTFGALIWAQPLPANTGLHMADSCLSHWGQSKWCMAGDDWKGHETSSYQLVTCAGRQQASNLAPFYGSASPASARCEWNCLGWCCPLSISLSAGSAGEAFHCGSWTLLSPWQPEIESGERKESNKWRKAKARQRTTKSRVCVKW